MVASGFNQTSPSSWFGGPTAHPFSRTGFEETGASWMMAMRYALTPYFLLGLIASNAPIGETLGYHGSNYYLFVDYSVATVGITGAFQLADVLHVGLGPAVYVATSSQNYLGGDIESRSATRIGGILDAGLSIPPDTRFFFTGSFQYRYVGKADVGPFTTRFVNSVGPTLPSTSAWFNHTFTALGLGIRL